MADPRNFNEDNGEDVELQPLPPIREADMSCRPRDVSESRNSMEILPVDTPLWYSRPRDVLESRNNMEDNGEDVELQPLPPIREADMKCRPRDVSESRDSMDLEDVELLVSPRDLLESQNYIKANVEYEDVPTAVTSRACCPRDVFKLVEDFPSMSFPPINSQPEKISRPTEVYRQDVCEADEQAPLEGSLPVVFDPVDEHPGIGTSNQESRAQYIENELDDILTEGDFDAIEEKVTPKTLTSCTTNALLKAFQVNKALRDLADAANPEKDDLETLEKSVNKFTSALIDPLKADADTRNTFQSCFDYVVDKAIDKEQKEFISHPVVYNLLNSRWYRSFSLVRKESWRRPRRWGYFFLNLLTVFDIVLFPFLFFFFLIVHLIKRGLKKRRETEMCFVVTLSKDTTEESFDLMKRTMSYIVHKYGYQSANYCLVLREENKMIGNINFGEVCSSETELLKRIEELEKPSSLPGLYEDLCTARNVFQSRKVRQDAKKVLVLFLNDKLSMVKAQDKHLKHLLEELNTMHVKIVPVGIGEYAKLSELNGIASKHVTARHFGEYESPKTLGTAVIQGVEGKDIYEKYMDYFTTPYFIFIRDTLSYLTLLGLHFAICLSPSTVAFSRLEWVILVFFLGRILMEVDQFISAKKAGIKARKRRQRSLHGSNYQVCSPGDQQEEKQKEDENIVLKRFTNYFRDRWNVLDFIILVFYLITFILRMITWSASTGVSDNRPLAVAEYFYGFIAMCLTVRAFGQVMECMRGMGAIQIALFFIISDVMAIFWQFLAAILAFSLAMTKIYVAEKSYTSGRDSDKDLACNDSGITCWWNMATHLSWSLLGLADLDSLKSVDSPSVSLIHFLYSLFLIMGVILLVNMMIALLSNTYQQVQDNSLKEWSFKKAITIRTYSSYHPVPVPFNLLSIPLMALCKCACRKWFNAPGVDEPGRRKALDKLVVKLQRRYFERYGYAFPLTDGKKVDHLLFENDGSRRMANQIARQVFRQRGNKQEKITTGSSAWESPGIGIDGCLVTYKGPDFCKVCKVKKPRTIHSARYVMPFTRETPRFEVLIQETGERRIIAVGAVFEGYDTHILPGWLDGTVGYHADDGKIFETGCAELGREVEGAMAHRGDLIACEVDFDGVNDDNIPVVFSLNGKEVARASVKCTTGQRILFPIVSLGCEDITVLTKMCPRDSSGFSKESRKDDLEVMINFVRGQHKILRDDMEAMDTDRGLQLQQFQQQLIEQWRMLAEIKTLVLRLNSEKQEDEQGDDNEELA